MSTPEWFLTLCQRRLSLSAVRVGLALFGAGTRAVDTGGNPIIHGQVSLSQLQKLTTLSRHSVIKGIEELEDLVGLVRHPSLNAKAACGYALPLVQKLHQAQPATSAKSAPAPILTSAKSAPSLGGEGGGVEGVVVEDISPTTTTGLLRGAAGEESRPEVDGLLEDLAELGAADPPEFLARFPQDRVRAWVDWMLKQPAGPEASRGGFKHPAGFIFRKLQEGKEPPSEPSPVSRFTRGKYGHVYRH